MFPATEHAMHMLLHAVVIGLFPCPLLCMPEMIVLLRINGKGNGKVEPSLGKSSFLTVQVVAKDVALASGT
eukprot:432058-Pelagomonas_calceolata.AAC.2